MKRANITLDTTSMVEKFVSAINSDGSTNRYVLENGDGTSRVNARSLLGVLYMSAEHGDDMFLVNESGDELPYFIDEYRS